jgi:adenylate cyclase
MDKKNIDDLWYWYLTGEKRSDFPLEFERIYEATRRVFRWFPGAPRCFECDIPLSGVTGFLLRPWGSRPSTFNSHFCSQCESFARQQEAGAEVELSLLFADVRGSTPLAENIGVTRFQELIRRFYRTTSAILIKRNAMVNRLIGDQMIALFTPRFAGKRHALAAIETAREILQATGHEDPDGPWAPVGVGVHTGVVYVGVVGSKDSLNEITVLGSAANLAARLSSEARAGEVLVSAAAMQSAGLDGSGLESRVLQLKGIREPVATRVIQTHSVVQSAPTLRP